MEVEQKDAEDIPSAVQGREKTEDEARTGTHHLSEQVDGQRAQSI